MTRRWLPLVAGAALVGAAPAQAEDRPSEEEMFGGPATATTTATGTASGGFGTDSPPHPAPSASRSPVAATATTTTATATTATTTSARSDTTTPSGGFGTEASRSPVAATKAGEDARDQLNLGTPGQAPRFSPEVAPEDPLKIGGQIYLRAQTSALQDQAARDWSLSSPSLLDVYMDVRPNDRVRGFVLGRMIFDPTLPDSASPNLSLAAGGSQGGFSNGGTASLSSLFGVQATRTPRVLLDQMWLRFDIKHAVFVTAGRQHVRWGTARFWTPTDFLHIQHRNPLDVFDARTGTTMIKLQVPWEAQGFNFYAYGLTEGADATPTASQVAGAARAEMVLGTGEVGAGALVQRGHKPKLAADFSAGIWDLDFYGEAALRFAQDIDRVRTSGIDPSSVTLGPVPTGSVDQAALTQYLGPAIDALYPVVLHYRGVKPQVTGGVSYSFQYADKDVFTLGAEYFYNGLGYSDTAVYPGLILPHSQPLREPATFFYLGRQYVGVFVTMPAPYSWDNTTFTLSNLANLSDLSGITRLDYSLILLTHLRFEAFGAVHWGKREGEFRFGMAPTNLGPLPFPGRSPALFDLGVGLRVAI